MLHASHPFITEAPLRLMLRDQLARLNRVIAESDRPDRVSQAHSYAVRVSRYIDCETDEALDILRGKFGQNGWAPAIDDICRHMEREPLRLRFTDRAPCGGYSDAEAA